MTTPSEIFKTLRVTHSASWTEARSSYRSLSKQYHPDLNGHQPEHVHIELLGRMTTLNAAWAVVDTEEKWTKHVAPFRAAEQRRQEHTGQAPRTETPPASHRHSTKGGLDWKDTRFMLGHRYIRRTGLDYTVIEISHGQVRIRYADGEQSTLPQDLLWHEWQQVVAHRWGTGSKNGRQDGAAQAPPRGPQQQAREAPQPEQPPPDLAWDDIAFVAGHWYANADGVRFRVLEWSGSQVRVRYPNGVTALLPAEILWQSWQKHRGKARGQRDAGRRPASSKANSSRRDNTSHHQHRWNPTPKSDPHLGWADATFQVGHWYATAIAPYEVLGMRTGARGGPIDIDIRFRDGRQELGVSVQRYWPEWRRIVNQKRAAPSAAKGGQGRGKAFDKQVKQDALKMVRRKCTVDELAQFLSKRGWARIVDNRAKIGPMWIIPVDAKREKCHQLMREVVAAGMKFTSGSGKASGGKPAWYTWEK